MNNLLILVLSLIYNILLLIVYFSKEKIQLYENKIYSSLIICNTIGIVLEMLCILSAMNILIINPNIIVRLYMGYLIAWGFILTIYVLIISLKSSSLKDEENGLQIRFFNKIVKIASLLFLLFVLYLMISPIQFESNNGNYYALGTAVNITYIFSFILVIINMGLFIKNFKNIVIKKYIPVIVYILVMVLVIKIQKDIPTLSLVTCTETFITFLMYFTIENPDVKMIKELEVAREQADKANRAKTDFLSSMSHEIRTPLNAIVGFSDCIVDASSLEEAKENAKDIVNASQTLLEIVNGILDISKIEAGKLEIVNSPYDAPSTFLELAKLITPKMNEKGLDFTFTIAPDLPNTLYGDHANIKKIVTNLLSNACKYTERGFVHYEVNCVNADGVCKLIITVEDSGRGIKKDSVNKLFTKFQRLDEDRNTTIEGTGLGLAITKQLIELMGGRIIVHTVYGEGSKFTVVLNQKIEATKVVEKKIKNTLDLSGVKILMVDDTPLNLKVGVKLLEKYGADSIVSSPSGFDCLDRIKNGEVYDIILLDDMMPKMSGVETLRRLKEIPGFKIPTIALTANAITGMREKYLADGFDDFLAKPIEKEQLINVLNQILGRSVTEEISVVDNDNIVEEKVNDNVETLESSEKGKTELIPVVDIDTSSEKEITYDKSYLEDNGVDISHALELLGDMDMYNMTINDFFMDVENKWNRIVDYKNKNDMENYAIEVHSLKSDCKYLGFMSLADIAYQHELKSKENDSIFVNDNFNKLEEEYKKVLEIARTYVEHNKIKE